MTVSEEQLQEQLQDVWRQPEGRGRFAAYDALFRQADAAGATEFAFHVRLDAVSDFEHGGDPSRALLAFAWCLAAVDRRPELLAGREHDLLWKFKWMVAALPDYPDLPVARVLAVLDDMERRYRLGGHSLHAVYQHRLVIAHALGDLAAADEWYDRLLTAPRDSLSDCDVCVPSTQIEHLLARGDIDEAVRLGDQAKRGRCMVQPQWILGRLLLPYLATGRTADAVDAHRTGYPPIRTNPSFLALVALHLQFCARSGNEVAGLAILERHLPWLENPPTPRAEMDFAAAAACVLRRLCATGEGDQPVQRRAADGTRRWTSTAAELQTELADRASALAARFDARNSHDQVGRRVADWIAAEPLVAYLPLTVLAGRATGSPVEAKVRELVGRVGDLTVAGDIAGAARGRLEVAYALRDADRWNDAAEAAEEAVLALDRAGLPADTARARHLLWDLYRRSYEHHDDALAVLDALVAEPLLPPDLPSVEALLEDAADLLYGDEAAARLAMAAERHRAAGRAGDELRALRKLLEAGGEDSTAPALARAEELLAADPSLPAAERGRVGLHAARVALDEDRADDGLARVEAAVAVLEAADLPEEWVEALLVRAELLLLAGRAADAEEQARALHASDDDSVGWRAGFVVVRALREQGRTEESDAFMAAHDIEDWELDDES